MPLLSLGPNGPYSSTSHTKPKTLIPSRYRPRNLSVYIRGPTHTSVCSRLLGFGSLLRELDVFIVCSPASVSPSAKRRADLYLPRVLTRARAKSFPL